MILRIYFILLAFFAIGGICFYFINRGKEVKFARNNWIKYVTYFFIINALFISIVFFPHVFRLLAILIILSGLFEMIRLYSRNGVAGKWFLTLSIIVYASVSTGFYHFSGMDSKLILFVFLVLSIFDSFSQITGQLAGRTRILPGISPAKTLEGLIGGAVFAIGGSLVLRGLTGLSHGGLLTITIIVVVAAFLGDMASSYYKRRSNVKDFSNLIPGHGGFLDRFDSFIVAGAFLSLLRFMNIYFT
jgi:phosphatidate cytidylyltransferase